MPKEIKAIACPQCGATAKTELKPGFYRCTNCGTEYFLDDDDVTVTHQHQWVAPAAPAAAPVPVKGILVGLGVAIGSIGLIASLVLPSAPVTTSTRIRPEEPQRDPNRFSWSSTRSLPLVVGGKPVVLLAGAREYKNELGLKAEDDPRHGLYLSTYDALTGAEIRTQRLPPPPPNARGSYWVDLTLRVFSDHTPYLLINDAQLYELDPATLTATDVTPKIIGRHPELSSGIATLQFDQDRWGDGLELLVNDGKKLHFYPLVDKLYNDDEWYRATHAQTPPLPGAKPRTYFTVTGRSFEYPNAPQQLLRIRYRTNAGGPEYRLENPSWHANYGGSGVFTDRDPHVKELIGADDRRTHRILDVKDLTPGRRYFDPEVRYADSAAVLLTLRTTAAPNAPLRLQCLDPASGAIRWTTPLGADDKYARFVAYAGGFLTSDGERYTVFSSDGKVLRSAELKYEPAPAP